MKSGILPNNELTVIIRDDSPLIFCDDSPTYRSVTINLTNEQLQKLKLRWIGERNRKNFHETISKCFIELAWASWKWVHAYDSIAR